MSIKLGVVILAAGEGTRMKIDGPKTLAPLLGRGLIEYPLFALEKFSKTFSGQIHISIVTGFQKQKVEQYLGDLKYSFNINFVHQKERLGTANAIESYLKQCKNASDHDYTLILCADTPLLEASIFEKLFDSIEKNSLDALCASFQLANPEGYGRIIRNKSQEHGFGIVEQKDGSSEELLIKEVNSGVYLMKTSYLIEGIKGIDNKNASGEFYLTDLFSFDQKVQALEFSDPEIFLGVNNLVDLQKASKVLRRKKLDQFMKQGVLIHDPETTYLDDSVVINPGVEIYPGVHLYGNTIIESGVVIESGSIIKNSHVHESTHILAYCHLEKAEVFESCLIGPYARLRPGAVIGKNSKIGNFVEIKSSRLEQGVKVSHLSYLGDAQVGEFSNIGCGFVTCNYDGKNKHKTVIGKNCFIGSDTQMIAPIELGDNCYVASGSTVNKSMPTGSFGIARSRQETKLNMASRFLKKSE